MSEFTNTTNQESGVESLDRLDELVSLLLDDALEPEGLSEVEQLLTESAVARKRYIDLAQLHGELTQYFRGPKQEEESRARATGIVAGSIGLPGFGGDSSLSSSDSAIG